MTEWTRTCGVAIESPSSGSVLISRKQNASPMFCATPKNLPFNIFGLGNICHGLKYHSGSQKEKRKTLMPGRSSQCSSCSVSQLRLRRAITAVCNKHMYCFKEREAPASTEAVLQRLSEVNPSGFLCVSLPFSQAVLVQVMGLSIFGLDCHTLQVLHPPFTFELLSIIRL